MPFPPKVKQEALEKSRRHCCICQEFAGRSAEVHHIVQEADSGANDLSNAIVLCERCHGEAGHYNPHHPLGNKYSPEELRRHRDFWWKWCEDNPAATPPKNPIIISPNEMTLSVGKWRGKSVFKVTNRSNQNYYQIWVKISILSSGLSWQNIEIKRMNLEGVVATMRHPVTQRQIEIGADIGIGACDTRIM